MKTIDYAELQTNFEQYVDDVSEHGEEVIITRNGRPLARLVPLQPLFGFAPGIVPPGFDWDAWNAMDEEIAASFYASKLFPLGDGPATTAEPSGLGDSDLSSGRQ